MPSVSRDYRAIAAEKQLHRQAQIPKEWLLPQDYSSYTNRMDVPITCGILSDEEINITSNFDATALLKKLRSGVWTAEQVTVAFCKRAAIAHQLVCLMLCGEIRSSH
jgi:amidase